MDPNETLKTIRALVLRVLENEQEPSHDDVALDLAEHVQALDVWLTNKGFLPTDWSR